MTPKERILATINGEETDRLPVALWRHFPHDDAQADRLAAKVIEFQKRYQFDLVKVTPVAGYPAESWGAELYYLDNANGTRGYTSRPVNAVQDWERLPVLDVHQGLLGRELEATRLIRQGVGDDVHVLQTIFSPLTTTKTLSDTLWKQHLLEEPDALHAGLKTITKTTLDFAKATLQAGADAIFFATQMATHNELTPEQYRTFGMAYDLQILSALQDEADFILLHGHGTNIMFDLLCEYPVQVLNWHDRGEKCPPLSEGIKQFKGAVLGGLSDHSTLVEGDAEAVQREARDAVSQTGGKRFILGTGCVTMTTTPEANIRTVRDFVD